MRLADGQKPKMSIQQIKRRERAEFAKAYKDEWEARMNPPAPPVKEVEAEKGIDLHETLLRASLGLLDSKIDMRLEPLRDRVRGPRISRGFSTSARAPAASDGPSPPILPQIDEQGPDTKPIRVAFLPENDFSRYHHYEQVATVAPPHKPVVSTVNDDASLISANSTLMEIIDDKAGTGFQASEVLDEVLYEVRAREKKDLIAPREDDAGEPLTEEKKVALKVFGLGAGVWYFFGEGVARFFGAA